MRQALTPWILATAAALALTLGAARAQASDATPSPLKLSLISDTSCSPSLRELLEAQLRKNPRIIWKPPTQEMIDALGRQAKPELSAYDLEALLWVRCAADGTLSVERYTRYDRARPALSFAQAPTTTTQARDLLRSSFEQVGDDVLRWRRKQRVASSADWAPWPELEQLLPEQRRQRTRYAKHEAGLGLMWSQMSAQELDRQEQLGASAIIGRYHKEAIDTYSYDISYRVDLRVALAMMPGDPYTSLDSGFWAAGALFGADLSPELGLQVGMGYQSAPPLSTLLVHFGPSAGLRWRFFDGLLVRIKSHVTFNPSPPVGIGWAWGVAAQAIIALGDDTNLHLDLPYQELSISRSPSEVIEWRTLSPSFLITRTF